MFDKIFRNTSYLEKGLDAAWMRQQVIANNIANVDTPGFKASRVEFEDYFKSALENENDGFKAKKTRAGHMNFGMGDIDSVTPAVVNNGDMTQRMDENDVDIDYEMAELAKNSLYYNTLATKVSQDLSRLRIAITEGR